MDEYDTLSDFKSLRTNDDSSQSYQSETSPNGTSSIDTNPGLVRVCDESQKTPSSSTSGLSLRPSMLGSSFSMNSTDVDLRKTSKESSNSDPYLSYECNSIGNDSVPSAVCSSSQTTISKSLTLSEDSYHYSESKMTGNVPSGVLDKSYDISQDQKFDSNQMEYHPSASFLNVGSLLVESGSFSKACNIENDASAALAIALDAHNEDLMEQGNNFPLIPPEPPLEQKESRKLLFQEYLCKLCNHIIVGATILDCRSGGSHAFCTVCIENYENSVNDENGWIVLSSDSEKYPIKKKEMKSNKNVKSPFWLMNKTFNAQEKTKLKICPTCKKPYSQHVPCRTLDVAISNFVENNEVGAIENEVKIYIDRCEQWRKEVISRRNELENERIKEAIKLQDEQILLYNQMKRDFWRDIISGAATTIAMVAFTVLVGGKRQQRSSSN